MARTEAQEIASYRTVRGMMDGAVQEMAALQPSIPLAKFDDLPSDVQASLVASFHPMLPTIAAVMMKYGRR